MNIACLSSEHCKYFLPKFPLCPQNTKTINCTMRKVPCADSRVTSCSGLTSRPIQIEPRYCQQYYCTGNTTFVSYVKPVRLHMSSITKAIINNRSRYTLMLTRALFVFERLSLSNVKSTKYCFLSQSIYSLKQYLQVKNVRTKWLLKLRRGRKGYCLQ